ncbi:MAG: NAD(P)/FAD-dependent oxidoreductase [Deltaproteobacteria bacterium]|nr:MAG: NAD(P)/FAD-dependent oxidoreductase [Deltaproteobacteria bacterium]
MMISEYDILVVGAGPAGSSAAWAAAAAGARVLVVERRKAVGVPVRCAEFIPRLLLGELSFRDRGFVVQAVRAMRAVLPDGTVKETRAPGLTIHRDQFDQLLADYARQAGVEILEQVRAVGTEDGFVVLKQAGGSLSRVRAKVIIGADGPHSTVGRWMGLRVRRLIPALQVRVSLSKPMEHTEVYFHPWIYGAYGWVFPKDDQANVGLAIAQGSKWSRPPKATLEWFVGRLRHEGKIKGPTYNSTFGWIPVEPLQTAVKGNMMLVGDAAGHTHPITGAGVPQAVACGKAAGICAAEAAAKNDPGLLKRYDQQWQEDVGEALHLAVERRKILERQWHLLNDILPYCWIGFKEYYERT